MADLENILEFDQNETNTLDNVIETELSKQKNRAISSAFMSVLFAGFASV